MNAVIFAWSAYEYIFLPGNKGGWSSSKILYPKKHNGKPTLILVHGFTGSPFDFKPLALRCRDEGYRVIILEVPGQGNRYFSFARGRFKPEFHIKWLEDIIINETRSSGRKPWIIGFSMGGTLSMIVAARKMVDRMVLISPFLGLPNSESMSMIPFFVKWLIPVIPKIKNGMINDPVARRHYIPGSMLISVHAFIRLEELVKKAVEVTDTIDTPGLVICSRHDSVSSYKRIMKYLSGKNNIDIHEYENGDHILLYDFDRELIIEDIVQFLTTEGI